MNKIRYYQRYKVHPKDTKKIRQTLKNKGFKEADDYQLHKCTIRIDLKDKSVDEILSGFNKNTRWAIRRGEEIKIRVIANMNNLKEFYSLYSARSILPSM